MQRAGREALRVEVEVAAYPVDEALRVRLVVDREARPVAEQRGLAAQDARARGVERRHPHAARDRPDELRDPFLHLVGGLVGEGDRQDRERRGADLVDEVRETVGEDPRLAGPGARDHEDRAGRQRDRFELRRVEADRAGDLCDFGHFDGVGHPDDRTGGRRHGPGHLFGPAAADRHPTTLSRGRRAAGPLRWRRGRPRCATSGTAASRRDRGAP